MLDIAGGLLIAGFVFVRTGITFVTRDRLEGGKALGWSLLLVGMATTGWIVFVHTGTVSCPIAWRGNIFTGVCPSFN
jgi:hypothetical protein